MSWAGSSSDQPQQWWSRHSTWYGQSWEHGWQESSNQWHQEGNNWQQQDAPAAATMRLAERQQQALADYDWTQQFEHLVDDPMEGKDDDPDSDDPIGY